MKQGGTKNFATCQYIMVSFIEYESLPCVMSRKNILLVRWYEFKTMYDLRQHAQAIAFRWTVAYSCSQRTRPQAVELRPASSSVKLAEDIYYSANEAESSILERQTSIVPFSFGI